MKCRTHPNREAVAVCQKYESGFCHECCQCPTVDFCCNCSDPSLYCQYRTRCLIWEMSRNRRNKNTNQE